MSSEKRLIALNIFESEVPPLKSSLPSNALFEKSCFSTQQTQKSFSMIASATFMRSAVSEKRSARARASMMATLFTRSSPQAALPRHKSNPHYTACPSGNVASPVERDGSAVYQSPALQHFLSQGVEGLEPRAP